MVGNRLSGVRTGYLTVLYLALFACSAAVAEPADTSTNCPGHPDAIGTSRTLVVDPRAHPRIGSMQYPETLPLRDHEVVLTFDDGPIPKNSYQVLQILADNCIKATFFEVGEQSKANPEGIRKLVAAGHTVGSHSMHHPLTFHKMSEAQAKQEVDDGIMWAKAAMTDPNAMAPFFRIPGLLRAPPVEAYLESQGIQTWSTDFLADDWHRISPAKVHDLAMSRLHAMGKGILLLHDIQARTVAALPKILHDMKAEGYHIVHVVAATPEMPATPTEPEQWQAHPTSEDKPVARWPKLPNFIYADADMLPAPAVSDFDLSEANLAVALDPKSHARSQTTWPQLASLQVASTDAVLPVPAADVFDVPEKTRTAIQPFPVTMHHYAEGELPASMIAAAVPHSRRGRGRVALHQRATRVAHAASGAAAKQKHQAARPAAGKRAVHVASLKKRKI